MYGKLILDLHSFPIAISVLQLERRDPFPLLTLSLRCCTCPNLSCLGANTLLSSDGRTHLAQGFRYGNLRATGTRLVRNGLVQPYSELQFGYTNTLFPSNELRVVIDS